MKILLLMCFTVLMLISCTGKKQLPNDGTKLIDYRQFTIRVPNAWTVLDSGREDSFVGNIGIDSNKFISFDLGRYANDLSEGSEDYRVRNDSLFVLVKFPTSGATKLIEDYRGKPNSSTLTAVTLNQKQYINVDGYRAKLITPTRIGRGTIGLYIDSLWNAGSSSDKYQINAHNLTPKQQEQFISAIKTLKFYQHPETRKKDDE